MGKECREDGGKAARRDEEAGGEGSSRSSPSSGSERFGGCA